MAWQDDIETFLETKISNEVIIHYQIRGLEETQNTEVGIVVAYIPDSVETNLVNEKYYMLYRNPKTTGTIQFKQLEKLPEL